MTYVAMELDAHRHMARVEREHRDLLPGQVDIAVRAANLCPTDFKKWDDPFLPARLEGRTLPLGHEFAGVVTRVAPDVDGVAVGDRVAVDPVIRCGSCPACIGGRPGFCTALLGVGAAAGDPVDCADLAVTAGIGGGFAEHVVVPAANTIALPDSLSFAAGSLVEPLADVMHSIEAGALRDGDTSAVVGLGPMGLLHVLALLADGRQVIGVDLREDRRALVESLGVATYSPDEMPAADAVFVTAGGQGHAPATRTALERLAPGGRVVLFSSGPKGVQVPVDSNRLHYRRQSLVGVVGFDRRHALEAIRVLGTGSVDIDLVRQPAVPLAEIDTAFENILNPGVLKTAVLFS